MNGHDTGPVSDGFRPDPELAALVDDCLDGRPDQTQLARLESLLAADPAAQRYYLDAMLLDCGLATEFSAAGVGDMVDALAAVDSRESGVTGGAVAGQRPAGLLRRKAAVFVAVGLIIMAALVMAALSGGPQALLADIARFQVRHLAEISRSRLAMPPGDEAGRSLEKGRRFGRERLAIESGAIEIAVRTGAMIILEGPAEIELVDERAAVLHRGTAVVRCGFGNGGFELETPSARAVTRGGEFAMTIDQSLAADVQVYSGEVVACGPSETGRGRFPRRLTQGQAARFFPQTDAGPEEIAFSETRFTRRVPDDTGIPLHPERSATRQEFETKTGGARLDSILVTRADRPVVVDGILDEWNDEGVFRAEVPGSPNGREWVEGRMMYDDQRLYIAARVGDPLPLRNSMSPDFNPGGVWRGGGLQVFFSGDRGVGWPADATGPSYYANRQIEAPFSEQLKAENPRLMTLIMTHHAASDTDRLVIGRSVADYSPEAIEAGRYEGRFVASPDGRGYTLEYAIPWATLGIGDDPPRSGDTLAALWEVHFSDETGRLWRGQIIEIRNLGEPLGVFPYERAAVWGRAEFR